MVGSASAIGEISRRDRSRCQCPRFVALPRPHWHDPAAEEPMGKWPILDKIEMIDGPIDEKTYEHELEKLQHRLLDLQVHHMRTGGRVIIGIDGWDAAGKGGLIERIVGGLEPKSIQVWRIGRADARGAGPPLSLALLEPAAGAGQLGDLRPHLVRPRAGRAHRGPVQQGGLEARLPRDQRVRAPARRRRRAHRQDPRPCQRRGAEAADDRPAEQAAQALQDRPRGLPQHRQAQGISRGLRRHAGAHRHRPRAMARHRHRQQGCMPG